jgi:hypothetical protein
MAMFNSYTSYYQKLSLFSTDMAAEFLESPVIPLISRFLESLSMLKSILLEMAIIKFRMFKRRPDPEKNTTFKQP